VRPAGLMISIKGTKLGTDLVNITVVDSDGAGVPASIRILTDQGSKDVQTDSHGNLLLSIKLLVQQRFDFLVLGTHISEFITIDGHIPEPKKEDLSSIWKAAVSGFTEVSRSKERQKKMKLDEIIEVISPSPPPKEVEVDRLSKIEEEAALEIKKVEQEAKLRKIYKEAGWPEEDIEEKIRDFRQRLYEKGI
jgi:hypothetical protein